METKDLFLQLGVSEIDYEMSKYCPSFPRFPILLYFDKPKKILIPEVGKNELK